jgi:hypothetical protein
VRAGGGACGRGGAVRCVSTDTNPAQRRSLWVPPLRRACSAAELLSRCLGAQHALSSRGSGSRRAHATYTTSSTQQPCHHHGLPALQALLPNRRCCPAGPSAAAAAGASSVSGGWRLRSASRAARCVSRAERPCLLAHPGTKALDHSLLLAAAFCVERHTHTHTHSHTHTRTHTHTHTAGGKNGSFADVLFFPDPGMPCRHGKACRRNNCTYVHNPTSLTK